MTDVKREVIGKKVVDVRESGEYYTPQEIVLEDGTIIRANGWYKPEGDDE